MSDESEELEPDPCYQAFERFIQVINLQDVYHPPDPDTSPLLRVLLYAGFREGWVGGYREARDSNS